MANTPLRAESAHANPVARRDMLTAALLGGAALASPNASPAFAQALTCTVADPVAEYLTAFRLYDDQDVVAASRFDRALAELIAWQPRTERDMLRKIVVRLDDHGAEPASSVPALLAQVNRLIEVAA